MFNATILTQITGPLTSSYSTTTVVSAGSRQSILEPMPEEATTEVEIAIDVSQLKMLGMRANGAALTVKTNNAVTPDNVFELASGGVFLWPRSTSETLRDTEGNVVTEDIVKLYVQNASTVAGQLVLDALVDPTL